MKKSDILSILKEKNILNFQHDLIFKFYENKNENSLNINTVEIYHLGKQIRLFSTYTDLIKTLKLNIVHSKLKLDAGIELYSFLNRHNYTITKTDYSNKWTDLSVQAIKTIKLDDLVDEIYIVLNYYYNLCIDYNNKLDVI